MIPNMIPVIEEQLREKDKEIERLKKREQECIDHYLVATKYASEMESKYISANYVINELEKWLEEQHQFIIEIPAYTKEISIEHKTMEICYENVLDKLQELKGSDKE